MVRLARSEVISVDQCALAVKINKSAECTTHIRL
ncbi:hypothetical protein Q31b_02900 [Novipirellula aureliae]|uniref:Uncharacterized protein n=1 Tax=Novipirellula aureliae TaxID=2527966 RepID=A0A5C6ED30_9BACT|nr:hypothetical protein Q31b_02900 [Novipirellula aureliae]